ncbi:MAG: lysine--tRNA ligase [Candidatus Pacebacteria bacterium]|nr:lysine--tRNA ligase [Candidatus Paceibacterota bacterium]
MTKTTINSPQSPHWVDKVVEQILAWQKKQSVKKLHVDDMKTPSGRVHVGALRGVMLHDIVAKALQAQQQSTKSTYVFNDMDPMDGLPAYLNEQEYQQHMGKPLCKIPPPQLDKSGIDFSQATAAEKKQYQQAKSFAHFYALDFIAAFRQLGCSQKIVWSHQLYESGQMDKVIKIALDKTELIKQVYQKIANYELPANWHPFQVNCEQCGKVGTTLVTAWDGQQVTYECQPNKVDWAQGCGHQGKVSPFGGTGKLLWKVDWPAHWVAMGVNIEGAGKDHTSAGGSRDMANALLEKVFESIVPFDIPYEWILLRGAKMSSSKGVGTSAREFTQLLPAELGRFLFVNKHYNQVIDFDPQTMAIPDLFDEYDQAAQIFWQQEPGDERLGRAFELSQLKTVPKAHFLPRFRDLALWMQHPELDLAEEFEKIKGSALTKPELQVLADRQHYAQLWVNRYAPAEYQLGATSEIPAAAKQLSAAQKKYLQQVDQLLDSQANWDPQELQQQLFELAKKTLGARQAFQAIYLAFLGKKSGPRAAWFLLEIDPKLRKQRIKEVQKKQ